MVSQQSPITGHQSLLMRFGEAMSKSRRQFLKHSSLVLLGAAAGCRSKPQKAADIPPGAPPAFGTSPPAGPEVSSSTFAEAEKLVQVNLTSADLDLAARTWRMNL